MPAPEFAQHVGNAVSYMLSPEAKKLLTYRVQGIPKTWSRSTLYQILCGNLNIVPTETGILALSSITASPYERSEEATNVATISISGKHSEHDLGQKDRVIRSADLSKVRDGIEETYTELVVDRHFRGFTPLYAPEKLADTVIDYIAITGLAGHAFGSWKERGGDFMWLRDRLGRDVPDARILSYGFESDLADSLQVQTVEDIAREFVGALRRVRQVSLCDAEAIRPIVFLAHSLGGVVLKKALTLMASGTETDVANFKSTYKIFFFAVPNRGLNIDHLTAICKTNHKNLLAEFEEGSNTLSTLHSAFCALAHFETTQVVSFYETKLSPTPKKDMFGYWSRTGTPKLLLKQSSATDSLPSEKSWCKQAINRNHYDICKFSRHDPEYHVFSSHLPDSNQAVRYVRARVPHVSKAEPKPITIWAYLSNELSLDDDSGDHPTEEEQSEEKHREDSKQSKKNPSVKNPTAEECPMVPAIYGVLLGQGRIQETIEIFHDGTSQKIEAPHLEPIEGKLPPAGLFFASGLAALVSLRGTTCDFSAPLPIARMCDATVVAHGVLVFLEIAKPLYNNEQEKGWLKADQRDRNQSQRAQSRPIGAPSRIAEAKTNFEENARRTFERISEWKRQYSERILDTPHLSIYTIGEACRTHLHNDSSISVKTIGESSLCKMLLSADGAAEISEVLSHWLNWVDCGAVSEEELRWLSGRQKAFAQTACILYILADAKAAGKLNVARN